MVLPLPTPYPSLPDSDELIDKHPGTAPYLFRHLCSSICAQHHLCPDTCALLTHKHAGTVEIVSLQINAESGIGSLETDPVLVQRVLLNLMANACRHTEGGSIEVSAKLVAKEAVPWIEFSVADTGTGITDQAVIDRIWDAFVSFEGSSGLGLYVVRCLIVDLLGGKVGFRPNKPHGSVFWFSLPYASSGTDICKEALHRSPVTSVTPQSVTLKQDVGSLWRADVLIIDDVQVVLALQAEELRACGLTIETASSGFEGLERCKAGMYALVICDFNMPGMNGDAMTRELRIWEDKHQRPTQSVYGLTAGVGVRAQCMRAGMQGVESKPMDAQFVVRLVEQMKPEVKDMRTPEQTLDDKIRKSSIASHLEFKADRQETCNSPGSKSPDFDENQEADCIDVNECDTNAIALVVGD